MGNFITIPKINAIWLRNLIRERKAHNTYTQSPPGARPASTFSTPGPASSKGLDG